MAADKGVFFRAPASVMEKFPTLTGTTTYSELLEEYNRFEEAL